MLSGLSRPILRTWQAVAGFVDEAPIDDEKKIRLHHYTVFIILGIPTMTGYGLYNLLMSNYMLCGLIFVSSLGLSIGWWFLRGLREGLIVYRTNAALFALLLLYMVVMGGEGGSKILWMYTFPLIAFFLLGKREGLIWSGSILVITLVFLWTPSDLLAVYPYPAEFKVRFMTTYLIVSAITYWFEYHRHRYRVGMESERRKLEVEKQQLSLEIEERRKAEEEKARIEFQLRRAQNMEAIGILAGGVAHDLNNILSGLVSYPELLLLDLPEDSPLRDAILTIHSSGQKAATIVQDLLTLARRGVATAEIVNLNSIASDFLRTPEYSKIRELYPNFRLDLDLDAGLLNILGSPVHLSKMITNLVSNAAEAMPDGGKIRVSTANKYIDRPIKGYDDVQEGDYVRLSVADCGIGIAQEDLERIFEPFYTKKVMGRSGTGLGMAVVWGTVKDHKGYIDVETAPERGTRFDLYFPVTRRESLERSPTLLMEEYQGNELILVVDDVREQREIVTQILTRLGYAVTAAQSGEEAVDYMKSNVADLLILDMIMDPGIDGLETYRRILQYHPGQKAIIASGYSETHRVKEAQRLGAGAYLRKPYVLEKLGMAIRAELDK